MESAEATPSTEEESKEVTEGIEAQAEAAAQAEAEEESDDSDSEEEDEASKEVDDETIHV